MVVFFVWLLVTLVFKGVNIIYWKINIYQFIFNFQPIFVGRIIFFPYLVPSRDGVFIIHFDHGRVFSYLTVTYY